jgi:lytic murein transglycosylase
MTFEAVDWRAPLLGASMALMLSCAETPAEEPPQPPRHPVATLASGVPHVGILGDDRGVPRTSRVAFEHCSDTEEGFADWLVTFREQAIAQGLPRSLAESALADVVYDPEVIELDRAQRPHHLTAAEFAASHVTAARLRRGRQLLATYASLFTRIEARFGVDAEILVALWGLETDFGASQGRTRSLDALATLAYDCRRAARFRGELESALHLLQRGDLTPRQMVGAWAGELGQTQFLPSSYERFGVDFDEDGKVNLIGSVDDALASTASYLAGNGWRAHEGYGPGSTNLAALASWNESEVYRSAVVLFAQKLRKG